jgi:hypothetical protein
MTKLAFFARRGLLLILWVAGLFWSVAAPAAVATVKLSEYQVKAAYLYNFARFIDWPAQTFPTKEDPVIIGVLGEDPFGPLLEKTIGTNTISGRRILIQRLDISSDYKKCHILFISRSETEGLTTILQKLKGLTILTVSEVEKFAQRGGMINFNMVEDTVKLEINRQAAEQAGLQVSSRLLGVATIVKTTQGKEGG